MRAAFLTRHGDPEVLEVGELPDPQPASGEVLVKVKAAALNHLDVWVRRGLPGLKLEYPHVLGGDGAGVIARLGAGVVGLREGDEVLVHPGLSDRRCEGTYGGWETLCPGYRILGEHVSGTHAEYVKVPAENVFAKPAALSFTEAAAIPLVFTTAWQMVVRRAQVKAGDVVVIHAAGSGVSSAAIQIAVLHGAEVIATAGSREKLDLARGLGAHHGVNYREEDFVARVKGIAKRGADVIIDHVGRDLWESNLKALRWGGHLVLCGATSGAEAKTDLAQVFYRQLQISGSTMGSKADFAPMLKLFAAGRLKAVVDRTFPLAEVRAAHRHLERREQFGKVCLSVS